jgi:hypothetical protein
MEQAAAIPFTCRIKSSPGECLPDEGFCAFEFPWCEGCPKLLVGKASKLEDPMKSLVCAAGSTGLLGSRNKAASIGGLFHSRLLPPRTGTIKLSENLF